jgi:C4-dicarboxylate transporter DctM subunit
VKLKTSPGGAAHPETEMVGIVLLILLFLLAIGLPVAAALGSLGFAVDALFSTMPLGRALGEIAWTSSNGFLLLSIPLYVMLGELLLRSGMADRMYEGMSTWLSWLPGGLMHSNIGACAAFAATCGSSAATAATIATVAIPQAEKHGYSQRLFLGSLASGGTLGILIPPSINMIIYGALTDTSIPKLYLAGIVPGLLLAGLFMLTVLIACVLKPSMGGTRLKYSWGSRLQGLLDLLPALAIFLVIVISIYGGFATATESAALGLMMALVLAAMRKRLSVAMFLQVFEGTVRTTSMIMLIIVAAFFLNFVLGGVGVTGKVSAFVTSLQLSPYELLLAVVVFYIVIGCFMETLSIMVTTLPFVVPLMVQAGFDPVWFGIVFIILIEMALITPPVGLNLYVIQGVRRGGSVADVMIGSLPFALAMLFLIGLLSIWPSIAMFMPNMAG